MSNSKAKEAEYRENTIGTQFISCPSDQYQRVFINGQILSADNFPNSQIYISYKITLPPGWKPQASQNYSQIQLTPEEIKQMNCLQSITHSTRPILQNNELNESITKFYFCFPIDLQLIVKQSSLKVEWPTINFEVFSNDFWDRTYMQGCGFAKLPNREGFHEFSVPTWKPKLKLEDQISQYFLGGLVKPKNIEDISKGYKINEMDQPGPINRILFNSISTGNIQLRLNISTQSKQVKNNQRVNYKAHKYSEQTEAKKIEKPANIPSLVNTGQVLGGRYTNTKLS